MDITYQTFLDCQIKDEQLYRLELELDLQIIDAAKSMSDDALEAWNPYGNKDVLGAIRESRLLESSVILFDLDGYGEMPEGIQKTMSVLTLLYEARDNFADVIIGMPQYFVRPADKEAPNVFMWDMKPKLEIPIPNTMIDTVFYNRYAPKDDERTSSRYKHLNYRYWYLQRKKEIALAFLKYAQYGKPTTLKRGSSWLADKIVDELNQLDSDIEIKFKDPLLEVMGYISDIENLGWIGDANCAKIEKVLLDIATRSKSN